MRFILYLGWLLVLLPGLVRAEVEPALPLTDALATNGTAAQMTRTGFSPGWDTPFAFALYRQLAAHGEGNLLYSPASVLIALSMTYAGARGETAQAIADSLHYPQPPQQVHALLRQRLAAYAIDKAEMQLHSAQRLWVQQGYELEADFLQLLEQNYHNTVGMTNFFQQPEPAREQINQWVQQQTADKIRDLLPAGSITPLTRLVLVNAVHLWARWQWPFDPGLTRPDKFIRLDGSTVEAPFMERKQTRFAHAQNERWQALELPYRDPRFSLLLVMPKEGEFSEVERALSAQWLEEVRASLRSGPLNLRLPRFSFTVAYSLKTPLAELGMSIAFSDRADFSAMSAQAERFILDDVFHKAFIQVDEEGTEAAAATAVVMARTAFIPAPEWVFKRPFLFFLQDQEEGTLLFMGRVLEP